MSKQKILEIVEKMTWHDEVMIIFGMMTAGVGGAYALEGILRLLRLFS